MAATMRHMPPGNPVPMIAFETGWFHALLRREELTQAELVKVSGVNRMTVRAAYHGQQVSAKTAIKLLEGVQRYHDRRVRESQQASERARKPLAARPAPRPCGCGCGEIVYPSAGHGNPQQYVNRSHRDRAYVKRKTVADLADLVVVFPLDLTG